jgi:hypothetical protein
MNSFFDNGYAVIKKLLRELVMIGEVPGRLKTLCKPDGIAHKPQYQRVLDAFQPSGIAYKLQYQFVLYLNPTPVFAEVSI